jgi:Zn-dependent protease
LFKLAGPFAKTGLTMLLSVWVYGLLFGWQFGLGFVLLIFVHELGHVFMAKACGIRISAPLFIPFFGAQILLRQELPDAWVEARIGVAGPIAGAAAAGFCHLLFAVTGLPIFAALAYVGYWLNFFNLIPIVPLDGGRIMASISPWAWLLGYALMAAWFVLNLLRAFYGVGPELGPGTLILLMVLVVSFPRILRLFRKSTPESLRYYSVAPIRRWTMAAIYFGLVAGLWWGMHVTAGRAETRSDESDGEPIQALKTPPLGHPSAIAGSNA